MITSQNPILMIKALNPTPESKRPYSPDRGGSEAPRLAESFRQVLEGLKTRYYRGRNDYLQDFGGPHCNHYH